MRNSLVGTIILRGDAEEPRRKAPPFAKRRKQSGNLGRSSSWPPPAVLSAGGCPYINAVPVGASRVHVWAPISGEVHWPRWKLSAPRHGCCSGAEQSRVVSLHDGGARAHGFLRALSSRAYPPDVGKSLSPLCPSLLAKTSLKRCRAASLGVEASLRC